MLRKLLENIIQKYLQHKAPYLIVARQRFSAFGNVSSFHNSFTNANCKSAETFSLKQMQPVEYNLFTFLCFPYFSQILSLQKFPHAGHLLCIGRPCFIIESLKWVPEKKKRKTMLEKKQERMQNNKKQSFFFLQYIDGQFFFPSDFISLKPLNLEVGKGRKGADMKQRGRKRCTKLKTFSFWINPEDICNCTNLFSFGEFSLFFGVTLNFFLTVQIYTFTKNRRTFQ